MRRIARRSQRGKNDQASVVGWEGGNGEHYPILINAGDGHDLVSGGPRADTLNGGAASDTVRGRGGSDTKLDDVSEVHHYIGRRDIDRNREIRATLPGVESRNRPACPTGC